MQDVYYGRRVAASDAAAVLNRRVDDILADLEGAPRPPDAERVEDEVEVFVVSRDGFNVVYECIDADRVIEIWSLYR